MQLDVKQFLESKDTLSVKSLKQSQFNGYSSDMKSQEQNLFYKGKFNMPTPEKLQNGNNSFKSTTFSSVYRQSFQNSSEIKPVQTERIKQKVLLQKDICQPKEKNLIDIQKFFEQKIIEIQQIFPQKDQKMIQQFFIDNLDYFEHTFGMCLCFKCDCGLCKCYYEQKEQHKLKMKGQFQSTYLKDYESNQDISFKQMIMQKLNKNPPGVNPRDLQGFNSNNQAIEQNYMTNNRINYTKHNIPLPEIKKDYKFIQKQPSTKYTQYQANYFDYLNLDQFEKMENIPHFNKFRGLQFNSKVPFGSDNNSELSRNYNFINQIKQTIQQLRKQNTISQIFPLNYSMKTTNNSKSIDFSKKQYKEYNQQFQPASVINYLFQKIQQISLESFHKLEGDVYSIQNEQKVQIQTPFQCKYENQKQIHDLMKQKLLERLQSLSSIQKQ